MFLQDHRKPQRLSEYNGTAFFCVCFFVEEQRLTGRLQEWTVSGVHGRIDRDHQ